MIMERLSFIDIVFSWGTSILIFFAVVMTIIGAVNGNINSVREFFTEFATYLVYAGVYIIIRLVPDIDNRPPFYPKKKVQ